MEVAEIELQVEFKCLGCNETFDTDLKLFDHTIRCDKYYELDTTDNKIHDYCYEHSKDGKVIVVNKKLHVDFNYVRKNKYRCRHFNTEKLIQGMLEMNTKMKNIYSNDTIAILSDCITSEEIVKIIEI